MSANATHTINVCEQHDDDGAIERKYRITRVHALDSNANKTIRQINAYTTNAKRH